MHIFPSTAKSQYWIVVGFISTSTGRPKFADKQKAPYRHQSYANARKEAERLATQFPGRRFEVFKWKGGCVIPKSEVENAD